MSHPLIYTERRLLPKLVDTLLTLLIWIGFSWMIYQGLISVLQAQPDAGPRPLDLSVDTITMYVLIALINSLLLILWAQYNQYRFAVERRTRRNELSDEELADCFGIASDTLLQMKNNQVIVVSHDRDGTLTGVHTQA
ncbi:MAG: poly-beta-1,6-N-acetyl-D-glucosamine biosynthesis protein PgaD [Pseudomonas sp.]